MMNLHLASIDEMLALRQHFSNLADVQRWGGEGFLLPLTRTHFMQQLQLPDTASYLLSDTGRPVGFGQLCDRFDKHHLARLLIFPQYRGRGFGRQLMLSLLKQGLVQNPRLDFSLFVYTSNKIAVELYQSMGFVETSQPQAHRNDLMFMTLSNEKAKSLTNH